MARNPGKLVTVMALLLVVWVVVYWAWTPRAASVGFDKPADLAPAFALEPVDEPTPEVKPGNEPFGFQPIEIVQRTTPSIVPPEFEDYTVARGDTSFEVIAKKVWGNSKLASAIARSNPLLSPTKLRVGTVIKVPKDPSNIQGRIENVPVHDSQDTPPPSTTDSANETIHVVRDGETLSGISRRYYGTTTAWKRILDANSDILPRPERLKVGMQLKIPPKE